MNCPQCNKEMELKSYVTNEGSSLVRIYYYYCFPCNVRSGDVEREPVEFEASAGESTESVAN